MTSAAGVRLDAAAGFVGAETFRGWNCWGGRCGVLRLCLRGRSLLLAACATPPAPRRSTFVGRAGRRARRLAGLPAGRAPAYVRAPRPHAPSTWARPGASQRCPAERDRAPAGDPASIPAPGQRRARGAGQRAAPTRTSRRRLRDYTGLGFDACTAPSRALDVGLGRLALPGDRRLHRRRQPRLLAAEPDRELGRPNRPPAGWRLIPTYVGLQAPTSSCSSLRQAQHLEPDRARRRGPKRRRDAVAEAQSVGIGARQPDLLRHGEPTRAPRAPPTRR